MSIATRALTSARDRLKQAEDSYRRSTGNEQTKAKKARCVEVAEYILKAVERQISEQYNPPLTLDELRKVDGEPLWLQGSIGWNYNGWSIVKWRGRGCISICEIPGCSQWVSVSDYGKTWLAYRHKPKEG